MAGTVKISASESIGWDECGGKLPAGRAALDAAIIDNVKKR